MSWSGCSSGAIATATRAILCSDATSTSSRASFGTKVGEGEADLIQKTFLSVLEAEANYRGEGTFRGFLIGVASNVLRHHYRSKARHEDRIDFGTVSVFDPAPGPYTRGSAADL